VGAAGDATPSDDDPRLIRECQLPAAGFEQRWGCGTTPCGDRAHRLVQWCADIGTRDGLIPSAVMIREDYPQTTVAMIEDMLARRHQPRGWDVIDRIDTSIWAEGVEPSDD